MVKPIEGQVPLFEQEPGANPVPELDITALSEHIARHARPVVSNRDVDTLRIRDGEDPSYGHRAEAYRPTHVAPAVRTEEAAKVSPADATEDEPTGEPWRRSPVADALFAKNRGRRQLGKITLGPNRDRHSSRYFDQRGFKS